MAMDQLKEECGIVAAYHFGKTQNVVTRVVRGLLDLQNRGQLSAGITSFNPQRNRILQTYKQVGTVQEVFRLHTPAKSRRILDEYAGHAAIGHNRYATSGSGDAALAQPFERVHGRMWKWFAIAFNGNLANYDELKEELEQNGYHITYHTDTEIMMHSINRELRGEDSHPFPEVFASLARQFDGAYNIAFINAEGDMVVARDPKGIKPLAYGVNGDLLVAASESLVLTNQGIDDIKHLAPGEMLIANADGYRVERYAPEEKPAYCHFEWVYFSNLASNLDNRPVFTVRQRIGEYLAKEEPLQNRDDYMVIPVPETAVTAAASFAFHMKLPLMNGLLRNRYLGRTFIEGANRGEIVRMKFTPLKEILEGKKIFLVDDSLVRGTTLKTVIEDLRDRGHVAEVHVRIGNPPIMGPCFYGIDMPTLGELFAPTYLKNEFHNQVPPEVLAEMAQAIGADSLSYISTDGLVKAIDLPKDNLCLACVNSDYPTEEGRRRYACLKAEAK